VAGVEGVLFKTNRIAQRSAQIDTLHSLVTPSKAL
jgi:hypothetical protein